MKILTVNAGSSSLKFNVIELPEKNELISGYFQRIGIEGSFYYVKIDGVKTEHEVELKNHMDAVECLKKELFDNNIIKSLDEIDGVGHRLVHGGDKFKNSVIITDEVLEECEEFNDLAPLHNPPMLACVRAFKEAMPETPMVAVFDTSFHQSMSPEEYIYPVPYEWYTEYGVRKYGFHGTSHRFIYRTIADVFGRRDIKVISCHLGSGASVCAIDKGRVVDTTMGFSPLAGLMMGTRSGDIDESLIPYIVKKTGKSYDEVFEDLNKHSGFLGVSGVSSDSRDIEKGVKEGNERCILANNIFNQRVANYIAQYNNQLYGADVIVFTAGLGENSIDTRKDIIKRVSSLGVKLDEEANDVRGKLQKISAEDSKIPVYVVPTNEELMIALDTYELISE
ncbi:MAG: acetate kinase [Bacilli bacterium]|nr:acetate kinase [Bacilli bacterium]